MRGEFEIPEPLSTETAPYPVPPPRRPIIIAPAPTSPATPAPGIPVPRRIAQPEIPAPQPIFQPQPFPQRLPPVPSIPRPRPPPTAPRRRAVARPKASRIARVAGPAASVLRTILRPSRRAEPLVQRVLQTALQPVSPIARPELLRPPTVGDLPGPAIDLEPLTPLIPGELRLSTSPQQRAEECKCEETEEEKEARRRPSRVIAQVKSFARRMSLNSLDNLRR